MSVAYFGDLFEGAVALMRDSGEDVDDVLRRAARNLTRLRGQSHEIAAPEQFLGDGPCPNPGCEGRQRRERGTVRTHVWMCGCPVVPRAVLPHLMGPDHQRHETLWRADGLDVHAWHPTEEGAIAAWRVALAEAQRREDAEWLPEASDAVHADQLSVATITRQS